jgi:hypothetical protein
VVHFDWENKMSTAVLFKRLLSIFMIVCLTNVGFLQTAGAAAIDTQTVVQLQDRAAAVSRIQANMARDDVRQAMVKMGVDPAQAHERVATLTDAEVASLDKRLAELPAGGDAGWIILLIVVIVVAVLFATGRINLNM